MDGLGQGELLCIPGGFRTAGGLRPREELVAAMSALTAPEREALVLHYLADLSVAEVAD